MKGYWEITFITAGTGATETFHVETDREAGSLLGEFRDHPTHTTAALVWHPHTDDDRACDCSRRKSDA